MYLYNSKCLISSVKLSYIHNLNGKKVTKQSRTNQTSKIKIHKQKNLRLELPKNECN